MLITLSDQFCSGYTKNKEEKRDQVMDRSGRIPFTDALAEKHDISGLVVGEYPASGYIGTGKNGCKVLNMNLYIEKREGTYL